MRSDELLQVCLFSVIHGPASLIFKSATVITETTLQTPSTIKVFSIYLLNKAQTKDNVEDLKAK